MVMVMSLKPSRPPCRKSLQLKIKAATSKEVMKKTINSLFLFYNLYLTVIFITSLRIYDQYEFKEAFVAIELTSLTIVVFHEPLDPNESEVVRDHL